VKERERKKEEAEEEKTSGETLSRHCCMSVEYYSDNYYGGYGELANPLQWPQLRKKRRLVASKTTPPPPPPLPDHHYHRHLNLFESPPRIGPTRLRIRPARSLLCRPWSRPLTLSLTQLLQTLLLLHPKVLKMNK